MVKKSNNIWNSYTQKKTNVATRECWHCTAKNIPYGDWSTLQISMEHQQMIVPGDKSDIMLLRVEFIKRSHRFCIVENMWYVYCTLHLCVLTLFGASDGKWTTTNIFPNWKRGHQKSYIKFKQIYNTEQYFWQH